ncbi:aminotransferase class V-fold PLP-dependent enzyme [Candidatus Contubernalis alkaliaceticus]|uniref:aminotransferase class V-fold PLP-dependent enzyme n=1 Tax=Candidatus Contubernalis alkaliaceticus TaxID=338645 RepID=UPI001F4C47F1|nr:aminotransferase class V-fold PLP-dependent enzyme [Candidatus Contubernalis alkalaceticus]UNC93723.1 aminotransferase class V-fold PLP-dependent enzyme [Candidatus Contubernalis alkalaceticus]
MIYLDNAATTWPKPESVYQAVLNFMRETGANPGRGGHRASVRAGKIIEDTRKKMARLFNVKNSNRVIFTFNATHSINLALKGLLNKGDHVIATALEHNSTLRPLFKLMQKGVRVTIVPCSSQGYIDPMLIKKEILPNTRLICLNHASNVLGTITPVQEVGNIARENDIIFMLDAAQTAGVFHIDVEALNIDLLTFPGHKGLMGPQGIGGLCLGDRVKLDSIFEGGTGSVSESFEQPSRLPDKLESGTPNTPGIAGLGSGIDFILQEGMDKIRKHEIELTSYLLQGLGKIEGIKIYGPGSSEKQAPLVAFNVKEKNSTDIAYLLDKYFDIATRSGLHCAPLVHKALGTMEQGAVRVSIGYFNTRDHIDKLFDALENIMEEF